MSRSRNATSGCDSFFVKVVGVWDGEDEEWGEGEEGWDSGYGSVMSARERV